MDEKEKEAVKEALLELIEECRKGASTVDDPASDRLVAASEAAKVLLEF